MPVTSKKPLYIASGITELNKKAGDIPRIGHGQCKKFLTTAEKVFKEATLADSLQDEERAYCLYMRYFNIITAIKKTDEFKNNEAYFKSLIGVKNCLKAVEHAEELSEALNVRYRGQKDEAQNGLGTEDTNAEQNEVETEKDLEKVDRDKDELDEKSVKAKSARVLVEQVYAMIRDDTPLLLMDVRSCEQFEQSHINHKSCINVPVDILPPGITVAAIDRKLPESSRLLWSLRGSTDLIVLYDWDSSVASLDDRSALQSLKFALYKWDRHTILKTEPLVMEGGYERWLLMYPTLTTNSTFPRPPSYSTLSTGVASLEKIDYDFGILEEPETKPEKPDPAELPTVRSQPVDNQWFPMVDRSTKPKSSKPHRVTPAPTNGEILSVRNKLDSTDAKLEKVINTDVGSQGSVTSDSVSSSMSSIKIPQRPDSSLKPTFVATGGATVATRGATVGSQEAEFKDYELRNRKAIEEHEAKLVQVKVEEENIVRLKRMKQDEAKATADLMRRKRAIETEIRHLEEEEERRRSDLDRTKDASSLRQHPKPSVETIASEEETTVDSVTPSETSVATPKLPDDGRSDAEVKHPMIPPLDAGRVKTQTGREQRVADGKGDVIVGKRTPPVPGKAVPVSSVPAMLPTTLPAPTNLPKGWDTRFDKEAGRYFYVNHNTKTTSWERPTEVSKTEPRTNITRTKLKDESDVTAGGALKRSHSSPNIAKMLQDVGQHRTEPSVDRTSKPAVQADMRSMPAHTELSAAKVRNLQGQWGNVSSGLTGLRNLGNTCYMNSIIQCLSNTPALAHYFRTDHYRADINKDNILGKGGEIAEEFSVLIKALWSGQYRSIAPRDFKGTIARHHALFAGYDQQDSQEMLVFLMDSLHEDLNRVKKRHHIPEQMNDGVPDKLAADRAWNMHKTINQSVIVELFQGQFKSTVMCLTCGTKSVTFDTFMYLPLPIPSSGRCSIKECLHQFLAEEKMTKESRWNCPHCKCKRDAVKNLDIWRLPPILLVHLKRFYMQGMWRDKINTHVNFPVEGLDMSQHLIGPQKNRAPYNLYAVSNHYGTMEGGHYTAFCKNTNINKWFKYDDQEVYEIAEGDIKSPAAYILFYTSIKMQPAHRGREP